jgi:hypothetical protein
MQRNVPTIRLQDRIAGSLRPDTVLTLTQDGDPIDSLASYTWQIEATPARTITASKLWTKSSGFTASATGVSIAWADADLGALTASDRYPVDYVLELTGTYQSKAIKYRLELTIHPQLA